MVLDYRLDYEKGMMTCPGCNERYPSDRPLGSGSGWWIGGNENKIIIAHSVDCYKKLGGQVLSNGLCSVRESQNRIMMGLFGNNLRICLGGHLGQHIKTLLRR